MNRIATALVVLLAVPAAQAVELPRLFSDGMVVQRDQPVQVWGRAAPGAQVTVSFAGTAAPATQADADGRWSLELPAQTAGGPHVMRIDDGTQPRVLNDVLVGDVWLASGQSNMEWSIAQAADSDAEIARATDPQIRHFKIPRAWAGTPQAQLAGGEWVAASPQVAGRFSAVAHHFARELRAVTGVPVGIIDSTWGGSRIEAWIDTPSQGLDDAKVAAEAASLGEGDDINQRPALLYNAMIHPLQPYAMRGVIWYQGESNANTVEDALRYRRQFPKLIEQWRGQWRTQWDAPSLPFLWVQLANYSSGKDRGDASPWAVLREAQSMTLWMPGTAQAVTVDIGDPSDIHPRNKQEVGRRLALAARHVAYGEAVAFHGPTPQYTRFEGKAAHVEFGTSGGTLAVRGGGTRVRGFALAGTDQVFHPAEATLQDGRVVVRSAAVPRPAAVRYGWSDNPVDADLVNTDGLPASPFRSDNW